MGPTTLRINQRSRLVALGGTRSSRKREGMQSFLMLALVSRKQGKVAPCEKNSDKEKHGARRKCKRDPQHNQENQDVQ